MPSSFLAFRIHRSDDRIEGRLDSLDADDLTEGELMVEVEYSTINYKDALAATGAGKILRTFPLVGGIDLAGEVLESSDDRFKPGDKILAIGGGQSETCDGGYSRYASVRAENAVLVPETLDTRTAMALGTAGFTAALAIHRMEQNDQSPEMGPVLVTGATGGVGSVAIDLLSGRGYDVTALTGKAEARDYLESLGATDILDRGKLELGTKPLEHASWGGAIDNLGGDLLAWLTRTIKPGGNIASVGLAAGHELRTTVMPFILRGVNLLGINMAIGPPLREALWNRLGTDLRPRHVQRFVTREIGLDELPGCFDAYISGTVVGRTLVRIRE